MALTENGHPVGTAKLGWEDNGVCGAGDACKGNVDHCLERRDWNSGRRSEWQHQQRGKVVLQLGITHTKG